MDKKILLLAGCLLFFIMPIRGQQQREKNISERWNVKSNFLYDLTGTMNLGVEMSLADHWSLDFSGSYNGWNWGNNKKWKHWMFQPEGRWWTKEVFKGHFFAFHALGGEYNMGKVHFPFGLFKTLRATRHEGWYVGGGLGYGYRWSLSQRWGIEAETTVGYLHFDYRFYNCPTCGERLGKAKRHYLGPTKVAVNLIYRFGKRKTRKRSNIELYASSALPPDTVTVVQKDTVFIREKEPEKKLIVTTNRLSLHYKSGQSKTDPLFSFNPTELSLITSLINNTMIGSSLKIKQIMITGYASPEGSEAINERLSMERAMGVYSYLATLYPDLVNCMKVVRGGEDWQGLLNAVRKDPLVSSRSLVIRAVEKSINGDANAAKTALLEVEEGRVYHYLLESVYPRLRRVECQIEYSRTETEHGKEER